MLKKLIGLFIAGIPLLVEAQVTISVQLPPAGMIQKDQLWNLVLVNTTNTTLEATVLLNIQDAATGQTVLSGSSRSITLSRGVKTISMRDVQPIQYNYGSSGFSGSYLPLGAYIACYTLTKRTFDAVETIAYECVNIHISPLSPPVLTMPADRSLLATAYPQFSWTPPAPMQMFDNLNYEIIVAEVQAGQSPVDAVRFNTPVYVRTNSQQPFETYPSSYSRLDTTKTYAWQVSAKNGMNYSVATEVWTFGFQTDSSGIQSAGSTYILLAGNGEEARKYYIDGSQLLVKYYSFDKEHEAEIKFFNAQGRLIKQQAQKIIYGNNYLRFELNRSFQPDQVYRIELTDLQNHIHTANFSINKSTN